MDCDRWTVRAQEYGAHQARIGRTDADRELPVDYAQEFALEDVEFRHGNAADLGVDAIATESVTQAFA